MTEYVASDRLINSTPIEQPQSLVVAAPMVTQTVKAVSETIVTTFVAIGDAVIVLLTGIVALLANPSIVTEGDDRLAFILVGLGVLVAVNLGHILSAFHFSTLRRPSRALTLAFLNWMILAVVMVLVVKLADVGNTNDQLWAAEWLAAALVLLLVSRLAIGLLVMRWTRAGRLTRHAAILGAGAVAERIIQYLGTLPDRSLAVNGIYDDRHQRFNDHQTSAPIRGSSDDLLADIRRRRVDTVIVALPMAAGHRLTQVVEKLRQTPVTVMLCRNGLTCGPAPAR